MGRIEEKKWKGAIEWKIKQIGFKEAVVRSLKSKKK